MPSICGYIQLASTTLLYRRKHRSVLLAMCTQQSMYNRKKEGREMMQINHRQQQQQAATTKNNMYSGRQRRNSEDKPPPPPPSLWNVLAIYRFVCINLLLPTTIHQLFMLFIPMSSICPLPFYIFRHFTFQVFCDYLVLRRLPRA